MLFKQIGKFLEHAKVNIWRRFSFPWKPFLVCEKIDVKIYIKSCCVAFFIYKNNPIKLKEVCIVLNGKCFNVRIISKTSTKDVKGQKNKKIDCGNIFRQIRGCENIKCRFKTINIHKNGTMLRMLLSHSPSKKVCIFYLHNLYFHDMAGI